MAKIDISAPMATVVVAVITAFVGIFIQLNQIHVLVNSRLTEALKEISYLKETVTKNEAKEAEDKTKDNKEMEEDLKKDK